ncbi:MAG: FIST C-terminal domain-containing protein [Chloroflexota bacterium]|nr:FIST C-terminal domain-containing protein [Chloroflexota bacterium]
MATKIESPTTTREQLSKAATRAGVGYSENPNSQEAGAEAARAALANAGIERCDLALLFTTSKHDPHAVLDGVHSVIGPDTRLVGGYAVGIITNDRLGYEGHQVGVAVLSSGTMKAKLFIELGLDRDERAVGARLGERLRTARIDGEPNLLLMYDGVRGPAAEEVPFNLATRLLEGLTDAMGKLPTTAGVGMFGDMQFNPTHQFFDDRVEQQAAIALLLHGNVRMDTIIMHGCKPSGAYHTITEAEGPVVLEIDGKPAFDAIADMLGPDADRSWQEYPLFITLGVNRGDKFGEFREQDYANHLCMTVDQERRALVMFEPNLPAGTEVQLMRRSIDIDYVGVRTRELLARVAPRRPFFALYIDCCARASAYCDTESEEAEAVQQALGDVPLLGFYSGVEIAEVGGSVEPLDWTGVLCIFSEPA